MKGNGPIMLSNKNVVFMESWLRNKMGKDQIIKGQMAGT